MPLNYQIIEDKLAQATNLINKMKPLLEVMSKGDVEDFRSAHSRYAILNKAVNIVENLCDVSKRRKTASLITEDSMNRVLKMLDSDYDKCNEVYNTYNKHLLDSSISKPQNSL